MSEPKFPDVNPLLTRDDAINQILSSIAMEETGLSHILNSEGEKIQYALGTIPGLEQPATIDDVLALNKSVCETLEIASQSQRQLRSKMQSALNASVLRGPQGETGAVGTILGSYTSLAELQTAHPTGSQGDAYLVGGSLYVWNTATLMWENVGDLTGPPGPMGPRGLDGAEGPAGPQGEQGIQGVAGTVGTIVGSYATEAELRQEHPTGVPGEFYYVNPDLFVWDDVGNDWLNVGEIAGPQGIQGEQGPRGEEGPIGPVGPVGTILGSYDTLAELEQEHPTGNQGDAFLVEGGLLYVWNINSMSWEYAGNLSGPQGPAGPEASSYTIIPFASQIAPKTFTTNGVPIRVSLLGFGYGDGRNQGLLTESAYSILLNSDGSFDLGGTDNGNYQLSFSLPFDMTIRSIALTTGNWASFSPTGTVFPYVQIYSAAPASNTFMPVAGATAVPTTGIGPGNMEANIMRSALTQNLEINLEAGTRIAIGGLARITGDNTARYYFLYFTGAIGMTRWVR